MKLSDAGKRLLVGRKLASTQLGETLLPKRVALPVFASDALSSVAYAPDEILITLSLAGLAGYAWDWRIALLVALVMLVVIASYRQNVRAYPSGGGDYEVATTNLGPNAGISVASALLVDYVLTVAVSVSSGIQNATAVLPFLDGHEGTAAAVVILVLMALNLRGIRESGTMFAIPTYCFMVAILGMIGYGLFRILVLGEELRVHSAQYGIEPDPEFAAFSGLAMALLLARAFSSGSAALTGIEAISNGVPSFRKPKSRNAATTLALLGACSISMMLGVIALAKLTGLKLVDLGSSHYTLDGQRVDVVERTAIGQLAETVFSGFPIGFYFVVGATMVILFLAANTAFNGFPVLGSILARDGYLPRQLHTRGDRLAFSNGIVVLAVAAALLVLVFQAEVTALIQLYVVGVFVSFTVSQIGMVRHWTRHLAGERDPAARRRMQRARVINAIGLTMTGTVLVIVVVSKFTQGAYLAILAMIAVFGMMKAIRRHYDTVADELALAPGETGELPSRVRAVVLVSQVHKATMRAVYFAKAAAPSTLEAVTVAVDPERTEELMEAWDRLDLDVPLKVIASPYREVTTPLLEYVKTLRSESPRDVVCVYVPEYVVGHWWEQLLHNQSALRLKALLLFSPGVMVTSVPYQLRSSRLARGRRGDQRVRRGHGPVGR
ncbi:APC family permease [Auraticoccus monumenti]|uniref:Amino acid transporter n=1 Tax=Auraticoccus monumenti TaxID=675864 RepID=A0A1G7CDA5_9ACTN|nr:APC family permease [Auraticoccus monumenti]SDE37233.1 Amino acid transporter [Auraticoccus monumenti]